MRNVDAMSRLVGKLKVLKCVLTNWEHWLKQDLYNEFVSIENCIAELFLLAPTGILSLKYVKQLTELKARKEELLDFEALYWTRKSWAVWIEQGDVNTMIFQNFSSARHNGNVIWDLHDSEGSGIHEDKKLKEVAVDFFSKNFKEDCTSCIQEQL